MGSDGSLYIADQTNTVIRKMDPTGTVSTVAGQAGVVGYRDGPGTNALFGWTSGLALDRSGTLYVSDSGAIRKISPAGVVSTMARLNFSLTGLVVDSRGSLYSLVTSEDSIVRIDPDGNITTWVGSGAWGYLDGQGTNAWLANPIGLTIDSQDNLYVTENTYQASVRKVSPEGEVSTLGGATWGDYADGLGPFAGFWYPRAIAVDSCDHLLVVDDQTVRRGTVGPEAHPQILSQPQGRSGDVGGEVTLSVQAQGTNALTYQWLVNGEPIDGATAASLHLKNLRQTDAGEYRVAVSDGVGYVFSFPVSVQVFHHSNSPASPLHHWHRLASLPPQQIHGLAYGNGRYVTIGGRKAGSVATSIDGEHWVKQFPITTEALNGVAFGNGRFVAVGERGSVLTSINAAEWEVETLTSEGRPDLQAIAFDQGTFVAVSGDVNGSIWTSPDGINWTNRGVGFGVSFLSVTRQGGRFIAAGNTIMTSTNGLDWEPAAVPSNYLGKPILLGRVLFGNGTFLAGNGVLATSSNGWDWRDITPTNGLSLTLVAFINGQFVAVDNNSDSITTSPDGITWSPPTPMGSSDHLSPYYEHGLFLASGNPSDGNVLFTSADGMSWTPHDESQALPFVPDRILSVGGRYFGGGWQRPIETSTNGSDWHLLFTTTNFNDIGYGDAALVAVGDNDLIFSSQDGGSTWMDRSPHLSYGTAWPRLWRIAYGGGVFVAVGELVPNAVDHIGHLLTSEDGAATWKASSIAGASYGTIIDVAYGNGMFVALTYYREGGGGVAAMLTSTNGLAWKLSTTVPTNDLETIAFGNGQFVISTFCGTVITTPDGVTWHQYAVPDVHFSRVVFGNGLFLASGRRTSGGPGVWSSSDGVTWIQCAGPDGDGFSMVAGDGCFFAIGPGDTLYQSGPFERLVNPRWLPNMHLEWTVSGAPNINYRIEYSEDLRNWQTLEEVTNAPASRLFVDPGGATNASRFYRVVTK